jgi:hypothetical protein
MVYGRCIIKELQLVSNYGAPLGQNICRTPISIVYLPCKGQNVKSSCGVYLTLRPYGAHLLVSTYYYKHIVPNGTGCFFGKSGDTLKIEVRVTCITDTLNLASARDSNGKPTRLAWLVVDSPVAPLPTLFEAVALQGQAAKI